MSTSKTLSNGTLSLRFMQRAKESKGSVQLEKADVKDDAEWEVSKEIREAWGIGDKAKGGSSGEGVDKVHEASYMPFLFGKDEDEDEGWGGRTKGRRVFNNKGEDVSLKPVAVQPVASTSTSDGQITSLSNSIPSSSTRNGKPLKTFERPSSISAKTLGKKKQSARDAIFGNEDVGVDLRAQRKSNQEDSSTSAPVPSNVFMKPAGVDEPKKPSNVDDVDLGSGVINGARAPSSKRRVEEGGDGEKKKRRKKKNSAAVES